MSIDQPRRPGGAPTGGQFAITARTEATDVDLTGGLDLTPIEEEFDALIDEAEHEHGLAVDALHDAVETARIAGTYGNATQRRVFNDQCDAYKEDLAVAGRRLRAVNMAANHGRLRPDEAEFAVPRTVTELRAAIRDAKAGKVRGITITQAATAKLDGGLDITGPADGPPLYIDVQSGFAPLRVKSGFVVVAAGSAFGNGVDVGKDATAVVLAGAGRKVSTTVDGGVAVVVGAEDARGRQFNRGGMLDVIAKTDAMTVTVAKP